MTSDPRDHLAGPPGSPATGPATGTATSPAALLATDGLVAGYHGVPVLHGVDLSLSAGSITAVLGANGAGKTTLLRTMSGLQRVLAGEVTYRGRSLAGTKVEDRVRLGIAHVPEGRGVIVELSVEENLRLGGLWRTGHGAQADTAAAIDEVLEIFEPLARRRKYLGHQLSGGERQMLALGRALVARPQVLLLDEPSLGLAPVVTARIMALLRDLRDRTGLTVLLVEQNVRSALQIADHGIVLALGRVVATGHPEQLLADDALRHSYLGF